MAERALKKPRTTRAIAVPPTTDLKDDPAQVTRLLGQILTHIQEIAEQANAGWSLGNGENSTQAGHLDAQYIDWVFSGANTEYEIPHALNRVPIGYDVVRKSAACTIYDSSTGSWGKQSFRLKSNTAAVTVRLRVY